MQSIKPGRLAVFIVICLALVVSAYFVFNNAIVEGGIKRGLDIAGGLYMVLEAKETGDREVDDDAIDRAITTIRNRVDLLGVAEPLIAAQGNRRLRIELPEIDDPERAREIIGSTAQLSFVGPDGRVIVTGEHLRRASAEVSHGGVTLNPYYVSIEFDREGAALFAAATAEFYGRQIAIVLDDEVISSPVVRAVITDGQGIIEGDFTREETIDLALLLRSGSLPVELTELEYRVIGPTLGQRTEEIAVYAAGIGLAAVFLFMLLYYRFAGLIAGISLVFYLTLLLGVLAVLGATLTLPGIAGMILSIGMAVDANVIIFERIKDELRSGRTVRTAMEAGFQRAFRAIIDANVTTLIAAAVLFITLTSGPVRGFAITLFFGILCSMFTAIILTRFLLRQAFRAGMMRSGAYVGVKI